MQVAKWTEDESQPCLPRRVHKAPSLRNRAIFQRSRVEERPLREVAAEFALSHTRVQVIVRQVERWLGETVGRGGTGDWLQRKGVAEHLHRERLHHLYRKALECLEHSKQELTTRKIVLIEGKAGRKELVTKTQPANWRFLQMALQAEDWRMKFDYESGSIQPPFADETSPAEEQREPQCEEVSPPPENEVLSEEVKTKEAEGSKEEVSDEARRISVNLAGGSPRSSASHPEDSSPPTLHTSQPTPSLRWRFAEPEDFSLTRRSERARRELEESQSRSGVMAAQISSAPPLEVLPKLFVVPTEPLIGYVAETRFKQQWQLENAEFVAARRAARSAVNLAGGSLRSTTSHPDGARSIVNQGVQQR